MENQMTEREAYKLYLEYGYDAILPFKAEGQIDFIEWLENMGWKIVND